MKKTIVSFLIVMLLCVCMFPTVFMENAISDEEIPPVDGIMVPLFNSFLDRFSERLKNFDPHIAEWMVEKFRDDEGNWNEDIGQYSWTECDFTANGEIKFEADTSVSVVSAVEVSLSFDRVEDLKDKFFIVIDDILYTMYPGITAEEIASMKEALFVEDILVSQMANASQTIRRDLYKITFYKSYGRVHFKMEFVTIY